MTSYLVTIRSQYASLADAQARARITWGRRLVSVQPEVNEATVRAEERTRCPKCGSADVHAEKIDVGFDGWGKTFIPGRIRCRDCDWVRGDSDLLGENVVQTIRSIVADALDEPSDILVERVAKRLAERRLMP